MAATSRCRTAAQFLVVSDALFVNFPDSRHYQAVFGLEEKLGAIPLELTNADLAKIHAELDKILVSGARPAGSPAADD